MAESTRDTLLIFGLGYTGRAVAEAALAAGFCVIATSRDPARVRPLAGLRSVPFDAALPWIADATHVLVTAAPEAAGDPVLRRYGDPIAGSRLLRWIGYFSTTGVYGDRGGAWVDEDTPVSPGLERTRRRAAVEQAWASYAPRVAVDLFRLAGIYGPGRSPFDDLRSGTARRVVRPGHAFGRIHRDDVAAAVVAALAQRRPPGIRILNLADDAPAEPALVVAEAARLLGRDPPPAIPFREAVAAMSPMARSFWAENRKVASRRTRAALGIDWLYPSYRQGLRAILDEERRECGT